jgi:hypothetical protein
LFLVHRRPIRRNFIIQIPIAGSGAFQPRSKRLHTLAGNEVPDGPIDKLTAFPRPGDAVDGLNSGFR